jgi:nitrogen fixation NifU-like protein
MSGFSETLMSHFDEPCNRRSMPCPDAVGQASLDGRAPYITLFFRVSDELIMDASFDAAGCGVTIAVCSMLTELVLGKTIHECQVLTEESLIAALDGVPEHKHYCVHLALRALRDALERLARDCIR